MEKERSRFSIVQIVISVLTLVLTPISSGLVVSYQLSKGHAYWLEQRETLRYEKMLDEEIKLAERVNEKILGLQNLIQDITMSKVSVATLAGISATTKDKVDVGQAVATLMKQLLAYRSTISDLNTDLEICSVYFSKRVLSKVRPLAAKLNAHFDRSPDTQRMLNDFIEACKRGEDPYGHLVKTIGAVDLKNDPEVEKLRAELLGAMKDDMGLVWRFLREGGESSK
jgi:hypothetical protein